jgi:predicted RND superfamily exporter protein
MIDRIIKIVLAYPKTVIICCLVLTILLASGMRNIRLEEDINEMLPKDLPARLALNELEDIFGGSDVLVVAVSNEEYTIFNHGTLAKIIEITDSLDVLPGVTRVTSLATVKHIKGEEWGMEVTPFLEEVPKTEEDITELKRIFFDDSLYVGTMVSKDGQYAAILAVVDEDVETMAIYDEVRLLASKLEGPEEIYLGGTPAVQSLATKIMKSDLRRLIPFVLIVAIIILFLSFRTWSGVFLPLLVTAMGVVSMIGLMGHLDIPFMMVNNVMPVMLVAVGVAYGIHVIAAYHEELTNTRDKRAALTSAIRKVGTPVIMAGLTTMAGFISLMTSPLPVYFDFGIILGFGVFMTMFFTLIMIPAMLLLLPIPKSKKVETQRTLLDRFLEGIASFVLRFRYVVIILGIIIIVISAFGIPRINMEMNAITFFPESSAVRQADEKLNQHLGGSINMNILFNADIESAEVLSAMDSVQHYLEGFPETGYTVSLATVVKRINRVLNADNPKFERIPETDDAVAQAILLYNMSGSPEDFEQFVDNSFEHGQVMAMMKSADTKCIAQIASEVERYCNLNFMDNMEIKFTGYSLFLKELVQLVVESVGKALVISLVLVSLLAWLTYRSWKIGVLAILPLAVTIILNFGLMGYAGIDLSIPTAMISSIVIGIGIDFSFHFISRFQLERKTNEPQTAVRNTICTVGRPILFNATATGFGFLVLVLSDLMPLRFMGLLIALTMMVCAAGALTILAASLTFVKTEQRRIP